MKIYKLFGWKDIINMPYNEQYVGVFGHSSYLDIFVLLIYKLSGQFKNITTLVTPQLRKFKFLCNFFNLIIAPSNENKNNNTIDSICENIKNNNLLISPKGTIKNKPWRSGYYYIAKKKNINIYPLIVNYSNKTIEFGKPVNPNNETLEECQIKLISQLQNTRLINMENAEYNISSSECPYETILPVDLTFISLCLYLPYLYKILNYSYYLGIIFCFVHSYIWHGLQNNKFFYKLQILFLLVKTVYFNNWLNLNIYYYLGFYLLFTSSLHKEKWKIFNSIANLIMALALNTINI